MFFETKEWVIKHINMKGTKENMEYPTMDYFCVLQASRGKLLFLFFFFFVGVRVTRTWFCPRRSLKRREAIRLSGMA
jgi:hypothetical protein